MNLNEKIALQVPATKVQQLVVCGFVLLLLQLTAEVAGHGLMLQPRSRNWIGYVEQNFYWAHGLNAGGKHCTMPLKCLVAQTFSRAMLHWHCHTSLASPQIHMHFCLLQRTSRHTSLISTSLRDICLARLCAGVSVVSDNGKLKYPSGRRGMCGDSYKETRWDTPGQVQATYMSGQVSLLDNIVPSCPQ